MEEARAEDRDETEIQRVDRNLEELMAELRVALPGVQVLFAFLLILPFNQRFESVSPLQEKLYLGTLMCTALAAVLMIAPTMHHRLQFRADRKARILRYSQRLALAGLSLLGLAMTGAVVLVCDFVFDGTVAAIAAALILLAVAFAWYLTPFSSERERGV